MTNITDFAQIQLSDIPSFERNVTSISDFSYIQQYCTAYFNQIPTAFALLGFVGISLLAIFGYKLKKETERRLWHGLIFAIWTIFLYELVLFFAVI